MTGERLIKPPRVLHASPFRPMLGYDNPHTLSVQLGKRYHEVMSLPHVALVRVPELELRPARPEKYSKGEAHFGLGKTAKDVCE